MSIVYLIAAHREPEVFGALVDSLEGARVIAHVDAKADLEAFAAAVPTGVEFVEDRVDVKWAGWSQIQAALALLTAAAARLQPTDYVVLLSGDSFPLQSQTTIERYFARHPERQHISSVRIPILDSGRLVTREFGSMTRLSRLRFEYNPGDRLPPLKALANKLEIRRPYRGALGGRVPHAGGQWWALTGAAVHWILAETERAPRFVRMCRHMAVPDEFYFQTLIMNSPFAAHVRRSLMYTDWSDTTSWSPATISSEHVATFVSLGLASPVLSMQDHLERYERVGRADERAAGEAVPLLFARKLGDPAVADMIRTTLWPADLTHDQHASTTAREAPASRRNND